MTADDDFDSVHPGKPPGKYWKTFVLECDDTAFPVYGSVRFHIHHFGTVSGPAGPYLLVRTEYDVV